MEGAKIDWKRFRLRSGLRNGAAWHRVQSQTQHWSCKAAHEQYNAGDSELKSLLQNTPEEEKDAQANVGSGPRMAFCDGCLGSERGQRVERLVVLETRADE